MPSSHDIAAPLPAAIFRSSKSGGLLASLSSVSRVIQKLQISGFVAHLLRSGGPAKLSVDAKSIYRLTDTKKVMRNLSGEEVFLLTIVAKTGKSQRFQGSFDNRLQVAAFWT